MRPVGWLLMSLIGAVANTIRGPVVSFTTGPVTDEQIDPATATAEVSFTNAGAYSGTGNVESFSGTWIVPTSAAGNAYEIRMTVNSGTTPSGSATGSWLGLGTTRTWTITKSGLGPSTTSNVTIEIRNASTLAVLSNGGGAFVMTATVTS
jgi:hypothetical protein